MHPSITTSGVAVIDTFTQAIQQLHAADAELRSILASDLSTASEHDAAIVRYADAVLAHTAAQRALTAALGPATPASATTPSATPEPYLFVRDQIRSWQHSAACLADANPARCRCGLAALQGLIEPVRGKVFVLTPNAIR